MNVTTADRLTLAFQALADPTRRAILARLRSGEATVMELAKPFSLAQPTITRHLQVLERAGLISRTRDAQRRPCRLEPEALRNVASWFGPFESYWSASFERLDALFADSGPSPRTPRRGGKK